MSDVVIGTHNTLFTPVKSSLLKNIIALCMWETVVLLGLSEWLLAGRPESIPSARVILLVPIPFDGMPYSALTQELGNGSWFCLNLMGQALLPLHRSPYLWGGVCGSGLGGGE